MDNIKHYLYRCIGGPYNDKEINLSTEGTATFQVGPYKGHYVKRLNNDKYVKWQSTHEQN